MVSYQLGENGLPPSAASRLIFEWHNRLRSVDVQFAHRNYSKVASKPGDFVYLDPPYKLARRHLYFGDFDHDRFFDWLRHQKGGYAFSLSGFVGDEDRRMEVSPAHFDEEHLLDNGVSPLRKRQGMDPLLARDSLYVKFRCP